MYFKNVGSKDESIKGDLCLTIYLMSFQIKKVKAESQTIIGDVDTILVYYKSGVSYL